MLAGHSMGKDHNLKTIAGFSELWGGSPVSRMRAGDTTEKLFDRRLSMHLMAQNIVAKRLLGDELFKQQGFLARILAWGPASLAGTREFKEVNVYQLPAVLKFHGKCEELLKIWKSIQSQENKKPRIVPLSLGALHLFKGFHNYVESKLGPKGEFESIRPFAAKIPQIAVRIALVLNFFHNPDLTEIEEKWMARACELGKAYLIETRRLWGMVDPDTRLVDGEKVRLWLVNSWGPKNNFQIQRKELYTRGPTVVRSAKSADAIIKILVDHGWVRFLADNSQTLAIFQEGASSAEKPLS